MKIYKLLPLLLFITSNAFAATYTGTKPMDLNLTTPTESNTKISEFNNSDREIKTVIVNLENLTAITGTYTVAGTQTGITGSNTSGYTISFPTASSVATGTITKRYMIKNINTGTITLNITVDGVGSPTVSGSQTFKIFTNGTSWFEERVNTAANASNATLLNNQPDTYYTNATNLATGTVNLNRIPGTLTGKDADTVDGYNPGVSATTLLILDSSGLVPLANIPTTLTSKDADTIDGINGPSIVQTSRTISTTTPLAGGGALSSNLTLSIPLATSGQDGYISSSDWTIFNNKLSTSVTISTTAPLTGGGDLSANRTFAMATATASVPGYLGIPDYSNFNNKANIVAGSGITSSSTTGTTTITNNGVLQIVAGSGISITGNGTGTPTITASGTSSAGGWTDTGTQTIATAGLRVVPQGTLAVHADYGMVGLLDAWIPDTLTVDSLTRITTRDYALLTGTNTISPAQLAVGTTTYNGTGTGNFTGTVTVGGLSGSGAGLTNVPVAFPDVTGSATGNSNFTATPPVSPGATKVPVSLSNGNILWGWMDGIDGTVTTKLGEIPVSNNDPTSIFLFHMEGAGSSTTFTNTGYGTFSVTASGNAQISTFTKKFGDSSGVFDGTGDFLTLATSPLFTIPAGSSWDFSAQINPDVVSDDDGLITMGATTSKFELMNRTSNMRMIMGTQTLVVASPAVGTWTQIYVSYHGPSGIGRLFYNGTQQGTITVSDTYVFSDSGEGIEIGAESSDGFTWKGYMDEVRMRISPATNFRTSNFNPDNVAYAPSHLGVYTETTVVLYDTLNNISFLKVITPGTATTEKSYVLIPATTTVFGLGTTTAITATTTAYSGWFDGAVRATAFNVASSEEIKRNIESIRIKPDWLDAEYEAKKEYIKDNRAAWILNNQTSYESVIGGTGTGTITLLDYVSMESGYNDYIEFAWASDLNKNTFVEDIQTQHEKIFWQMFNTVQPRSWNPKDKMSLTRKGFVVEEMPDVVKGDDKQSIDPMALLAYSTNVLQALKENIVSILKHQNIILKALQSGTYTPQEIETGLTEINNKLAVLENP